MRLINCEINLILTWSVNCVIVYADVANQGASLAITDTKLYIPVVTLPILDNKQEQISIKTRIISTKSKFKLFSWTKFWRGK